MGTVRRRCAKRRLRGAAVALAAVLAGAACQPAPGAALPAAGTGAPSAGEPEAAAPPAASPPAARPPAPPPPGGGRGPAVAGTAAALLASLPVRGRGPRTGYAREAFGQAWADVDRNGCDTRNDVLRRDLTRLLLKPGTNGCAVLSGELADPYTGLVLGFRRGGASEVDIDHVVALSDAWQTGASRWVPAKLLAFANDPVNLLAVQAAANRQKGDADAASWLPGRRAGRCGYVARQVAVKARYGLSVTPAERAAMARVLSACPGEPAPVAVAPTLAAAAAAPAAAPAPIRAVAPPAVPAGAAGTDRRYASCRAALAAGAGPYVRGRDPEYRWYRDGDGDGTVCE